MGVMARSGECIAVLPTVPTVDYGKTDITQRYSLASKIILGCRIGGYLIICLVSWERPMFSTTQKLN